MSVVNQFSSDAPSTIDCSVSAAALNRRPSMFLRVTEAEAVRATVRTQVAKQIAKGARIDVSSILFCGHGHHERL
jgi:hypothetical protein